MSKEEIEKLFTELEERYNQMVIDSIKKSLIEIISAVLNALKNKCIDSCMKDDIYDVNRFICRIREYNRLWNDMAEQTRFFEKDELIKYMKKIIISGKDNLSEHLADAAKFL